MPSATMNPEAQELLARVRKLPPDDQKFLAFDVLDGLEVPPLDHETIMRRIADVESGKSIPLTREESEREIKLKMRELGFEL